MVGNVTDGGQSHTRRILARVLLLTRIVTFPIVMTLTRQILLCGFSLLCALPERALTADWLNAGPVFDDFPLTLSSGHRTEAIGPFYYCEQQDTRQIRAVPPLLSYLRDPATDVVQFDMCYPLLTYGRYGSEYRWQLLQVLSFAGGQNQEETGTRRFTLFPLYFQQRSAIPSQNYTALVPFYGRLENRLFRDEIFFVMFPIYGRTRKGDVVTDNYLYPFFHLRHGEALEGWQIWPFTGHEHKDATTRTNGFGDIETVGGHDDWFVIWPLFFDQKSRIGTDNPQHQQTFLPFYSYVRSPARDSTAVLWPLFVHVTDRENQYREWETPWPLIVFARGEGKTTSRVWPFFSQSRNASLEADFYLWPIYKYNRVHVGALDRERTRIVFFLYSDTILKNTETGAARRRVDLWPLFTHQRDLQGNSRLQLFAPLEPLLPESERVERDYSPLWSFWRAESNHRTGATSQSLLWNLYRREATPEARKFSLFFGLIQYQSRSEGKRLRLFYIPVIKTGPVNDDRPK